MPISQQTATDIAYAWREVETAEKLLADISEALGRREVPDIRDAFGRRRNGLELGVPSGQGSTRLFDVPWSLACPIIEAHIARQKSMIAALSEKALFEIGRYSAVPASTAAPHGEPVEPPAERTA